MIITFVKTIFSKLQKLLNREYLPFLLVFVLLSIFAVNLGIYQDDTSYIFPSLVGNYNTHFSNYIRDNGPNRPLALIYYYGMFTLYRYFPALAHLIPVGLHILTAIVLYRLLKSHLSSRGALFLSLLVTAIPFWAESFSWFSASVGMVVRLFFYIQVYAIVTRVLAKKTLLFIFFLQVISSFLYETTILMPVALSFLWVMTNPERFTTERKLRDYIRVLILLSLPSFLYVGLKILVPHPVDSEFELKNMATVFANFSRFVPQLYELFWSKGPYQFWQWGFSQGFAQVMSSPFSFFVLLYLFVMLFRRKLSHEIVLFEKKISVNYTMFIFWVVCFFMSLIPLIWKQDYLPFRTLSFPIEFTILYFGYAFILDLSDWIKKHSLKDFCLFIVSLFLFFGMMIQIQMVQNYTKQYRDDVAMAQQIDESNTQLGFTQGRRVNVLISNMPFSTATAFTYGDYIYGMLANHWTAVGFIDLHSGTVAEVGIQGASPDWFAANFTKEEFLTLRPLAIYEYSDTGQCASIPCMRLTDVFN